MTSMRNHTAFGFPSVRAFWSLAIEAYRALRSSNGDDVHMAMLIHANYIAYGGMRACHGLDPAMSRRWHKLWRFTDRVFAMTNHSLDLAFAWGPP